MIDHLVGRPNPSWKRTQVILVILFWLWRIVRGNSGPPRILWLTKFNRAIAKRFTPWQIIVSTLTTLYAIRNFDKLLGLNSPEPLARLYSPSYYRATWIVTGFDAGFATAMSIRPKWLRDISSIVFSFYYILYAQEADEKLRRFRAVPTVEMLRTTWEKTTNPYLRLVTHLPHLHIRRKILLPRPKSSSYTRPITAYLFFAPPETELCKATELILDIPGGGFIAMTPEHHEERLRMWAVSTGRPVLSIDYGKAPEYPYPFARDEAFDVYRLMVESCGKLIGMSGKKLSVILSGDSAGGTLAVNVVLRCLELRALALASHQPLNLPLPTAVVLNYAALDFNFTSWMSHDHLRVLRSEQSAANVPGLRELAEQKDHLGHISPLSMVRDNDNVHPRRKQIRRRSSWKDTLRGAAEADRLRPSPSQSHQSQSQSHQTHTHTHTQTQSQTQSQSRLSASVSSHFLRVPSKSAPSRAPSFSPFSSSKAGTQSNLKASSQYGESDSNGYDNDRDNDSDEDDDDEDDGDYDYATRSTTGTSLRAEDRPIAARILYKYPEDGSEAVLENGKGSEGDNSADNKDGKGKEKKEHKEKKDDVEKKAYETQQQRLELALAAADGESRSKAAAAAGAGGGGSGSGGGSSGGDGGNASGQRKEPIGTRLTMTSRVGYFQDRIISPSMMRAMAILYIGPHRNPDFATNYHISPILTPEHLLAQFPPLLMQCGEKDPFVDDTVIFAGRVREAKRARKVELELALSGKSARFGSEGQGQGQGQWHREGQGQGASSRTAAAAGSSSKIDGSGHGKHLDGKSVAEMKKERDKLCREDESDWVQMVLFSEWSHGYLQMPTLMSEARAVIEELAEWIDHAFARYPAGATSAERKERSAERGQVHLAPSATEVDGPSPLTSETETEDVGITFVTKRQAVTTPPSRVTTPPGKGDSSGSEGTVVAEEAEKGRVQTTPRLTGQTISESELMRRRRLLDAHIFE